MLLNALCPYLEISFFLWAADVVWAKFKNEINVLQQTKNKMVKFKVAYSGALSSFCMLVACAIVKPSKILDR
jgi:hypothetical protein